MQHFELKQYINEKILNYTWTKKKQRKGSHHHTFLNPELPSKVLYILTTSAPYYDD